MKKTAVLLDLGFVLHKLRPLLGNRHATAVEVRDFALRRSGQLCFDGWLIKRTSVQSIVRTGRALTDSDFEPDLKQGVQVVLVTLGHSLIKRELNVHADELRSVVYP